MASSRGFWLRDHTPVRFGACLAGVESGSPSSPSTRGGTADFFSVVATGAKSTWRLVDEVKAREEEDGRANCSWRDSPRAARNLETNIGCVCCSRFVTWLLWRPRDSWELRRW